MQTLQIPLLINTETLRIPQVNTYVYYAAMKQDRADLTLHTSNVAEITLKAHDTASVEIMLNDLDS